MLRGEMKGYFLLGENPAVGSANSRLHRLALANLEWLVVRDLVEIESAAFWSDAPELEILSADFSGQLDLSPALLQGIPRGTIVGKYSARGDEARV